MKQLCDEEIVMWECVFLPFSLHSDTSYIHSYQKDLKSPNLPNIPRLHITNSLTFLKYNIYRKEYNISKELPKTDTYGCMNAILIY